MMELSGYRKLFPVTQSAIYLNHAAISPYSTRVSDALRQQITKRTDEPANVYPIFLEENRRLKENFAAIINARPENIAIIPNTSTGLNWLANGLEWQSGDRILLVEREFPSNIYPFLNLIRKGVQIDYVTPKNGGIGPAEINKKIVKKTKLLSISYVQFLNGFRIDTLEIGRLCKSRDIIFSVDGIQGVGAVPLDVKDAGIAFLSNGGHKWLMGPLGCGFMYVSPALMDKLYPVFAGWLSVKNSWDFFDYQLEFLDDAARFEPGTQNFLGIAGARAAADLLLEVGIPRIEAHLLDLGNFLTDAMTDLDFNYTGSSEKPHRAGIYSFGHPRSKEIFDALSANHIFVSLREGDIRVSPHFYNTREDLEELVRTIKKAL